ncbi:hypothetical protein [Bifidobacterium breve]|uniref:hypothetical protein n=1 Tax=Bifidobacterium breve TaxID=1685 RepID=UPI00069BDCC8|nr:hypothetical protein [Bifidobacterium breve]KOA59533.1 hypothetical protein BBM0305_03235 [Bifidobacterium breve MCC 0305]
MADDDTIASMEASQGTVLWLGDGTCAGGGASDAAHRYSTLTSKALGLVEENHAATGVGFATKPDIGSQVDAASKLGLAGVAPGCLTGLDDAALERMELVWTAIRLGAGDAGALVCDGLWKVCGSDPALCSSGGLPNDDGHALLAESIEASVREDQGEPLDQPVENLTRVVTSGGGDWLSRSLRESRRREAEKREANRPTGTELSNITSKLEDVTKGQALMQAIQQQMLDQLQRQQKMLESQQQQLKQQQDALAGQQDQLRQQQASLQSQQKQLESIVGQQGETVASLQTVTADLQKQARNTSVLLNWCNVQFGAISSYVEGYVPGSKPALE